MKIPWVEVKVTVRQLGKCSLPLAQFVWEKNDRASANIGCLNREGFEKNCVCCLKKIGALKEADFDRCGFVTMREKTLVGHAQKNLARRGPKMSQVCGGPPARRKMIGLASLANDGPTVFSIIFLPPW